MEGLLEEHHPQMEEPSQSLQLAQIEIVASKDRTKRDEWSEGGVLSLLEVYESKWLLRNRAKLKGSDWEDIARQVSIRNCGTKALKTPNQCKNKIESMKKRYRAESATTNNGISSWQFYARMGGLLKGTCCSQARVVGAGCIDGGGEPSLRALPKVEMEDVEQESKRGANAVNAQMQIVEILNCDGAEIEGEGNLQDSNQEDGSNTLPNNRKDRGMDSDISSPRSKIANAGDGDFGRVNPFKRRKSSSSDVADSIRLLAHSILKIEQARMEMYKDSERLRAEAEIRRGEMELKRTEIIAKTQLQIAKLLSRRTHGENSNGGSSVLRSEPAISPTAPLNVEKKNEHEHARNKLMRQLMDFGCQEE